jgi:hypothetical protein
MTPFLFKDLKNLCFQIEGFLNRSWQLSELSGENYPKSFYYAKFKSGNINEGEVILLCNKHQPIFAFIDPTKVGNFDNIDTGFVENPEIRQALTVLMEAYNTAYNILMPELLLLEFNGKTDFEKKLAALGVNESDIAPTIGVIKPALFEYKLFLGHNIGLDLFNSQED